MKIIFLDFDGVLNSDKYISRHGGGMSIDPAKLILLKQLVDATGAKLVLTTSWREHWSKDPAQCDSTGVLINSLFSACGLQIFDKTPKLHAKREAEIKSWLDMHPEVETFAVLDDMLLSAEYLNGHIVKTSNYFGGLDETDTQQAIAVLTD